MLRCRNQKVGSSSTMKRKKPNNKRRLYRNTRSYRTATVPKNATFEWVALEGYPSRPCFIYSTIVDSIGIEEAQPINIMGDFCLKKFKFSRTEFAYKNKPKTFVAALRKFNDLYGTNYV